MRAKESLRCDEGNLTVSCNRYIRSLPLYETTFSKHPHDRFRGGRRPAYRCHLFSGPQRAYSERTYNINVNRSNHRDRFWMRDRRQAFEFSATKQSVEKSKMGNSGRFIRDNLSPYFEHLKHGADRYKQLYIQQSHTKPTM